MIRAMARFCLVFSYAGVIALRRDQIDGNHSEIEDDSAKEEQAVDLETNASSNVSSKVWTDDELREEGYMFDWEFARERARRRDPNSDHWARMSASIHLRYGQAVGHNWNDINWIFGELTTSSIAVNQYWAMFNHHSGYVGYQVKSGNKDHFHCSVWDSQKHNARATSKIIYYGPGTKYHRFGHEGSGWQSMRDYPQSPSTSNVYSFAVEFEPKGASRQHISCYFRAPGFNNGKWYKQATVEVAMKTGGFASFSEQFWRGNAGSYREGVYGNIWYKRTTGDWQQIKTATSSVQSKINLGWKKSAWGIKNLGDGTQGWFLGTCGARSPKYSSASCRQPAQPGGPGAAPLTSPAGRPMALTTLLQEAAQFPKSGTSPSPRPSPNPPSWGGPRPSPNPPSWGGPRPSPPPPPADSGGSCFPPTALVRVVDSKSSAERPIRELSHGDKLLGKDGVGNAYLRDFHDDFVGRDVALTTYLRIEHEMQKAGRPLLMTANHLVFVTSSSDDQMKAIPAGEIRVGEHSLFVLSDGESKIQGQMIRSRITSVSSEVLHGLAAPLTTSGHLFVEGVMVSSYALLTDPHLDLWRHGPEMIRQNVQGICHALSFPFRVASAFGLGSRYLDLTSRVFDALSASLLQVGWASV